MPLYVGNLNAFGNFKVTTYNFVTNQTSVTMKLMTLPDDAVHV